MVVGSGRQELAVDGWRELAAGGCQRACCVAGSEDLIHPRVLVSRAGKGTRKRLSLHMLLLLLLLLLPPWRRLDGWCERRHREEYSVQRQGKGRVLSISVYEMAHTLRVGKSGLIQGGVSSPSSCSGVEARAGGGGGDRRRLAVGEHWRCLSAAASRRPLSHKVILCGFSVAPILRELLVRRDQLAVVLVVLVLVGVQGPCQGGVVAVCGILLQ